ncbi:hypothetical protein N5853_08885 [Bartonella sp. HY329]|uniref:hypothetical protein n=1 Tax=unclassified Bartonella TaxID=2645622 RepID=UPI0021C6E196|nr:MULTISPECIES: hypothetical protein [unclassified Bartonella]UXM94226.1 hypothetical protein N5853_08885 [Bartonella sp. HY329]UXN08549.1 hypothetical protein N5852_08895 [Bartonella sp. HY328]
MLHNQSIKKYNYLKIIGIKLLVHMAILLLGLSSAYAASVSWQNPKTGRIGTFPEDVSIEAEGIEGINIIFIFDSEDLSISLGPDMEDFFYQDFDDDEPIIFEPNAVLKGYPVQIFDDKKNPRLFFIDMGDRVWGVALTKGYKHPIEGKLFDIILETMKPRQAGDSFKLILPWTDKIIDLGEGDWSATSTYKGLSANREAFGTSYGKVGNIKNFDSSLVIYSENVLIRVNNYPVNDKNLDKQSITLMQQFKERDFVDEFIKTSISGRTVWKGHVTKTEGKNVFYYLVALKNRIWVVTSYVAFDDQITNAAKRIDIIEQIIASLPDNPPDIVTTYTNPQTNKQLKLPNGWVVLQEFDNGKPTDLGIVREGNIEDLFKHSFPILYSCAPKIKRGLKYAQGYAESFKKTHFGNRLVWMNIGSQLSVYTSDRLGACYLEIRDFDDDKVKLDLAEKLFATGKR